MDSKQEYLMQLQMLEQEANQFGEQLKVIDQQIGEMSIARANLEKLEKTGKAEMFSEFGKGIYLKGKLEKADLLVDVGGKIMVHKTHSEVRKIIDEQKAKFEEVKVQISQRIEEINAQVNSLMSEVHKENSLEGKVGKGKKDRKIGSSGKKVGKKKIK